MATNIKIYANLQFANCLLFIKSTLPFTAVNRLIHTTLSTCISWIDILHKLTNKKGYGTKAP